MGGASGGAGAAGGTGTPYVVQIDLGAVLSCVLLSNGTVRCWGINADDAPGGGGYVDIGVGDEHACAVRSTGTVDCWGDNFHGYLGNPYAGSDPTGPVEVQYELGKALDSVREVELGSKHSCAARTDGTVWCWGDNDLDQLGPGVADAWKSMASPISGVSGVAWLRAGGYRSCGIRADGTMQCWGWMEEGDGTLLNGVTDLAVNGSHTCAVKDSTALCWGLNHKGQLGHPKFDDPVCSGFDFYCNPTPTPVVGLGAAAQVSVGWNHSCARKTDGTVWCWGWGDGGVLGSDIYETDEPQLVPSLEYAVFMTTAESGRYSCAIRCDGTIKCWGVFFPPIPADLRAPQLPGCPLTSP